MRLGYIRPDMRDDSIIRMALAALLPLLVGSLLVEAGCGGQSRQANGTGPPARAIRFPYSAETRHAVEAALEELKGETHAVAECLTQWAQTEYSPSNIVFVAQEHTSALPPELERHRQQCVASARR